MRIPKMFGRKKETDFYDRVKKEAQAQSMSTGRATEPVGVDMNFTKEQAKSLPQHVKPWVRFRFQNGTLLTGFCHFRKTGEEEYERITNGYKDPGIAIFLFKEDGSPYPTENDQVMVCHDLLKPSDLDTEVGVQLSGQLAIWVAEMEIDRQIKRRGQTQ